MKRFAQTLREKLTPYGLLSRMTETAVDAAEAAIDSADPRRLDRSIMELQQLIEMPFNPQQAQVFEAMSRTLLRRYTVGGGLHHLRLAALAARESLELVGADPVARTVLLGRLGTTLSELVDATDDAEIIDEAVAVYDEAIAQDQDVDPALRAALRTNLAGVLSNRFVRHREPEDLERSLVLAREGLALIPQDDPARWQTLANIARLHRLRFEEWQDGTDLDRGISLLREALARPVTPPADPVFLGSSLGLQLRLRFEHAGTRPT